MAVAQDGMRCPLDQPGKLALLTGPRRSARPHPAPCFTPGPPPGPLRGQEYQFGSHSSAWKPRAAPAVVQGRIERGPRPGRAASASFLTSLRPNTDCGHPYPGLAALRLWARSGAFAVNAGEPLWPFEKHGAPALRAPRPPGQCAPATPSQPQPSPASGETQRLTAGSFSPRARPARSECYARQTAPGLRSAPPSRGAGAGGPKPSWP